MWKPCLKRQVRRRQWDWLSFRKRKSFMDWLWLLPGRRSTMFQQKSQF
ncbi:hypothetical protein EVA_14699 [gut metagenome]|uniref:Uncharacterized protein n=1 Tax=gut metagenome TaxID=749906 RepID=J9FRS1_9ZZZZ